MTTQTMKRAIPGVLAVLALAGCELLLPDLKESRDAAADPDLAADSDLAADPDTVAEPDTAVEPDVDAEADPPPELDALDAPDHHDTLVDGDEHEEELECSIDEDCDDGNSCTVDRCLPSSHKCQNSAGNEGTECRAADGPCDAAETCDGESTDCPADAVQPATVECGDASADPCDADDYCDGTGKTCPDLVRPASLECRASSGTCDVPENCNGTGKACPADLVRPDTFKCGDSSAAPCDADDYCDGAAKTCPDLVAANTVECRASGGLCDAPENCDGTSKLCPADAANPDFTPCMLITSPDRSYDICISGACVSPGCGDASCNAPGPNWAIPDTNQRACYNTTASMACTSFPCNAGGSPAFCGQDWQYGWDTTNPEAARFTRTVPAANQPVVLDSITGLIWQGCPRGQTGNLAACTGVPTATPWDTALSYCDGLSWGGYAGWRLPDRYELQSIVDYGGSEPPIDPTAFPGTPFWTFWSSSSAAGSGSYVHAWSVYFGADGFVGQVAKTGTACVRCVRSTVLGVPAHATRFTRTAPAGDEQPVVADAATGLVWQGCSSGQTGSDCTGSASTMDWQAALDYCQESTWAGFTDWYLPSVVELWSIIDVHRSEPAVDPAAFPATPLSGFPSSPMFPEFWSSSTDASGAPNAWTVGFSVGYTDLGDKDNAFFASYVRCVRVGP